MKSILCLLLCVAVQLIGPLHPETASLAAQSLAASYHMVVTACASCTTLSSPHHDWDEENLAAVLERQRKTTLQAFFQLNRHSIPMPASFCITTFPEHLPLTTVPERFTRDDQPAGRNYHVNPGQGEVYCLRLLLTQVAGPTSHVDLSWFQVRIIYSTICLIIATALPITCIILHADVALEKGLLTVGLHLQGERYDT